MTPKPKIVAASVKGRRLALAEKVETLERDLKRHQDAITRAHKTRTKTVETAIEQAYQDHRAPLESLPLRNRTTKLLEKLKYRFARGDLDRMPSRGKVQELVYRFAPENK